MCGIVGYVGNNDVSKVLIEGLKKLEYRGYDSAGIALLGSDLQIIKSLGKISNLEEKINNTKLIDSHMGIAHTRWATHGEPSENNAHPHRIGKITLVHNGIIENYVKLRKKLENKGYEFVSETDTEVLAHLLDYYFKGNSLEAITKVMHRVEGSYALGVIFAEHSDRIFAVRKASPLIVGQSDKGCFIASDVPAILKYTRNVYFMDNYEVACLQADNLTFYSSKILKIHLKISLRNMLK